MKNLLLEFLNMILILLIILNRLQNIINKCYVIIMNRFIKTECGLNKYDELKNNKGIFKRIRFYWFIIMASIRDKIIKL